MILNAFAEEMNQEIIIESQKKVYDSTTGRTTKSVTVEKTVPGAYYIGSSAENLVGERFKTVVDGAIIIDPVALDGYVIAPSDIINIDGLDYTVVVTDDVMFQGEVIVIGVKKK